VEQVIAPQEELIVLEVQDSQNEAQALGAYANRRGIKPSDIRSRVLYVTGSDCLL
jgi:hypothetical protein